MSNLKLNKVAAPTAPAAGKVSFYSDTNDIGRAKMIDDNSVVHSLSTSGTRDNNIILNGDFGIYQRGTHVATLQSNRVYFADRWGISIQVSSCTFSQVDTSGSPETNYGPQYYGKFIQTTAIGKFLISQVIPHANMAHLRGRTVRCQFKARQSAGTNAVLRMGLMQLTAAGTVDTVTNASFLATFPTGTGTDPTFPANHTLISPTLVEASSTIVNSAITTPSLTSSWTRYSATVTIPSNAKNLVLLIWTNAQIQVNDAICIGEVGIYDGMEIRDWMVRPETLDLLQCQRYYCKTFALATTPAFQILFGSLKWNVGVAGAVSGVWGIWKFPVRMRIAPPTIAFYSPVTAASAQAYQFSATAGVCTATSATSVSDEGLQITTTPAATAVIGSVVGVQITADAEL